MCYKFEKTLRELVKKEVKNRLYRMSSFSEDEIREEVDERMEELAKRVFEQFKDKIGF